MTINGTYLRLIAAILLVMTPIDMIAASEEPLLATLVLDRRTFCVDKSGEDCKERALQLSQATTQPNKVPDGSKTNTKPKFEPNYEPTCPGGIRETWIPIPPCGTYSKTPLFKPGKHSCGYRWSAAEKRCVEICTWLGQCRQ